MYLFSISLSLFVLLRFSECEAEKFAYVNFHISIERSEISMNENIRGPRSDSRPFFCLFEYLIHISTILSNRVSFVCQTPCLRFFFHRCQILLLFRCILIALENEKTTLLKSKRPYQLSAGNHFIELHNSNATHFQMTQSISFN